jgi:hypothetical protein
MKILFLTVGMLAAVAVRGSAEPATNVTAAPPILKRTDWGAKPPVAEMKRHTPTRITIHHTATKQKPDRKLADKLRALQEFSQKEGKLGSGKAKPAWPDVPYHFYVDCSGAIGEGRPVEFVGDTNTEYNPTGHVLVVLEGNFEEEEMTPAQLESLRQITIWLAKQWKVSPDAIKGHKDYASTACPGKRLEAWLPELRKQVAATQPQAARPLTSP